MIPSIDMPPTATRRTAPAVAAPVYGMLGDPAFYSGGGINLPNGNYDWLDVQAVMFTPTKRDGSASKSAPFLSVQVTMRDDEQAEHVQQYSMGSSAHLSWMPDPESGTRIIPVPNGPASGLNNQTNWEMLRKSLMDAQLGEGFLTDDLSVLNGLRVYMANIPEPEERKGFGGAKTGEVEEARRDRKVLVVQEILAMPGETEAPAAPAPPARTAAPRAAAPRAAAPAAAAPPARTAARPPARAAAPPPLPVAAAGEEVADDAAVLDAATAVLSLPGNSKGMAKLKLRAACFKSLNETVGPEETQRLMDTYWTDDETIAGIFNQLGYKVVGAEVKPQ